TADSREIVILVDLDEPRTIVCPPLRRSGALHVGFEVLEVELVVWRGPRGMGTVRYFSDAGDHGSLEQVVSRVRGNIEFRGRHEALSGDVDLVRRAGHELIEERVRTERESISTLIGSVYMQQRRVQPDRRHGDQFLVILVGAAHGAKFTLAEQI